MTLQRLLYIHAPASVKEADELIALNYAGKEVNRQSCVREGIRVAYRYEYVKKRVLGVKISTETAYFFGN